MLAAGCQTVPDVRWSCLRAWVAMRRLRTACGGVLPGMPVVKVHSDSGNSAVIDGCGASVEFVQEHYPEPSMASEIPDDA